MLTLYTTALSANGREPLALAHHLGLALDVRSVNVYAGEGRSAEYLAVHPFGKIPTLVDGDRVLWESNAILQYLDAAYGGSAENPFLPGALRNGSDPAVFGDVTGEIQRFLAVGIDGFFTDRPIGGVRARDAFIDARWR